MTQETTTNEMTMELSESQVAAEIGNAKRDIEKRLNALELKIGRPVLSMDLERLEVTTCLDEARKFVRAVRIVVLPPAGQIGKT